MTSIQERRDALRGGQPPSEGAGGAAGGSAGSPDGRWSLRTALLAVIAVLALAIAAAGGYLLRGDGSAPAKPGDASADAGFARDMITHHEQAVQMAIVVEYASADAEVRTLAFDIETSQTYQEGQMNGWLDSWGLTRQTSQPMMSWMDGSEMSQMQHDMSDMPDAAAGGDAQGDPTGQDTALMPGMATPAEMAQLQGATGTAQDVLFLQLMLRHHQGGVAMAQQGTQKANEPYVRALARKMVTVQTREVVLMEQMLRARGAQPLDS